jgi:quinoprotein glucose dehydrogenase
MPEFDIRPGGFEVTPLMIDGVVYASTSYHRVVALDAETGKQLWLFDPKTYEEGMPLNGAGLSSRGVAFWRGDHGQVRVLIADRQRLFSIDAKTGKPDLAFGDRGTTALDVDLGRTVPHKHIQMTSPPLVYKNLVIVGSSIPDRLQYPRDPPGAVQAFDVRTGKRTWVFHMIPQAAGNFGADTWGNNSWAIAGHANVWAPMTLDEQRGLLYLPGTTPSGDYWGGWRPGANLFAEALVCLDAATGKRRWHFQTVHHGVWDYDLPSPPTLATIQVNGRPIDAVAQVSKQGFAYVFDRVNGTPVWPVEERAVDTITDVPGEQLSPTQPFPMKPPALVPQGVTLEDANDLTPEIKVLATEELKRFRLGPLYTPPSLQGTVQRPSQIGGANWGGAAFDPDTGLLYVKVSNTYHISVVCKNDRRDPFVQWDYGNYCGPSTYFAAHSPASASQSQTVTPPPTRERVTTESINYSGEKLAGIPLIKPPYAYLVAVDLNKGEIAWRVPFGEGSQAIRQHPLLKGVALPERLGTAAQPGVLVTKGGLVFVGGGEPYLYAFNRTTGEEIGRVPTPFRTSGNPMTYETRSGRQFIVIATGAGPDAALAAFALNAALITSSTPRTPVPGVDQGSDAATKFSNVCGPCHGRTGRGGAAPALVPMNHTLNEVLAIVREGRGQMPPISTSELPDEHVAQIVEYLRVESR